jgi:hypothetical protein
MWLKYVASVYGVSGHCGHHQWATNIQQSQKNQEGMLLI